MIERPSQLPADVRIVAVDTETNGLYADSGARVAVVSLAWLEDDTGEYCWESKRDGIPHPVGMNLGCGYCRGRIVSVAFPFAQGTNGKPEDDGAGTLFGTPDPNLGPDGWWALIDWLRDRDHIYHNAKFDLEKLRVGTIPRPYYEGAEQMLIRAGFSGRDFLDRVIWDTQIVNKELWPTYPTGLKPTAQRLWGVGEADEQRALKPYLGPASDPRFDLVPWEVIAPYAAKDAELTLRLAHYQWDLLEQGLGHRPWIGREFEYMKSLYRMEQRGLPYDAQMSLEVAADLRTRLARIERGLPFRPTEPQAKKYFFTTSSVVNARGRQSIGLGLLPHSTTPKGSPQLTAETIDRLIKEFDDGSLAGMAARHWRDFTRVDTAITMWYKPYAEGIGPDERLRTCFRQSGTRSDRLSCERVNLQAIPHDYRLSGLEALAGVPTPRQIIAAAAASLEGWELWEFDLAQAELRVAALWADCQPMLEAIRENRDLHAETTTALFQMDADNPKWAKYRQIGKRGNFTLCFGAGAATFQRMVAKEAGIDLPDREAERIVRDWNGLYPEFRRAIDRHSWLADRERKVKLANGRFRWFASYEDTHKAFNQRVQASLAEFQKDWTIANDRFLMDYELDQRGLAAGVGRAGLLLTIHDSQVCLLPAGWEGQTMTRAIKRHAAELWQKYFPGVPGEAEAKRWK